MEWLTANWTLLLLIVGIPAFFLLMRGGHGSGMGCGGGHHRHDTTDQTPRSVPSNDERGAMPQSGPMQPSAVPQVGTGARGMPAPAEQHAGHGTGPNPDQRPRRRHGC